MMITTIVESCFSNLSLEWFEKIKAEFLAHPFYIRSEGKISDTIIEGELKIPVDMELSTYCWNNSVNSFSISGFIDEGPLFQTDAKDLTNPIIDYLEKAVTSLHPITEKYQIVKAVKSEIVSIRIAKKSVNDEYNLMLEYVTDKLDDDIISKFSDITSLAEDILSFKEGIRLEINQNELAILLILLYKAGVIDQSTQPEKATVDFIKNHFLYKGDETSEYKIPQTLSKQISRLKDPLGPWESPLNSLEKKLKNGLAQFNKLRL